MAAFFVNVTTDEPTKKQTTPPCLQYSLEERKLMSDILYEDSASKRTTVTFDREERRIMAEIARQNDFEEKANFSKEFSHKREQIHAKREEMEAEKKERAKEKLNRVKLVTKPYLLSQTVKQYDTKRSEVLERIHRKEREKRDKLQKAMSREKPGLISDITKKYDEKRSEVLERIQKKEEERKMKYKEKMNKVLPEKSSYVKEISKNYDSRRSQVLSRIKSNEDERKIKLEKRMESVENAQERHNVHVQLIREKSVLESCHITRKSTDSEDHQIQNEEDSKQNRCDEKLFQNSKTETVNSGLGRHNRQNTADKKKGLSNDNNLSFMVKSVLPPIECN